MLADRGISTDDLLASKRWVWRPVAIGKASMLLLTWMLFGVGEKGVLGVDWTGWRWRRTSSGCVGSASKCLLYVMLVTKNNHLTMLVDRLRGKGIAMAYMNLENIVVLRPDHLTMREDH